MGLILDTGILIAAERRREKLSHILSQIRLTHDEQEVAISTITVVELTHGIYRAQSEPVRTARQLFTQEVFEGLTVYPLSLGVGQLAGRIQGEQAARGNIIAFEDLVIGATALYLGFSVATLNRRHFERIPNLPLISL